MARVLERHGMNLANALDALKSLDKCKGPEAEDKAGGELVPLEGRDLQAELLAAPQAIAGADHPADPQAGERSLDGPELMQLESEGGKGGNSDSGADDMETRDVTEPRVLTDVGRDDVGPLERESSPNPPVLPAQQPTHRSTSLSPRLSHRRSPHSSRFISPSPMEPPNHDDNLFLADLSRRIVKAASLAGLVE